MAKKAAAAAATNAKPCTCGRSAEWRATIDLTGKLLDKARAVSLGLRALGDPDNICSDPEYARGIECVSFEVINGLEAIRHGDAHAHEQRMNDYLRCNRYSN